MHAFSLALGQQCCFYLSFRRLLAAVRQCVTIVGESSNDAYFCCLRLQSGQAARLTGLYNKGTALKAEQPLVQ